MIREVLVDKWFVGFLLIALMTTSSIHRSMELGSDPAISLERGWFKDDARIEDILRSNVDTNYTFLEIARPRYFSETSVSGMVGFFGRADVWRRHFIFYPLDPQTAPSDENWMLWGFIYIDGSIVIEDQIQADAAYQ